MPYADPRLERKKKATWISKQREQQRRATAIGLLKQVADMGETIDDGLVEELANSLKGLDSPRVRQLMVELAPEHDILPQFIVDLLLARGGATSANVDWVPLNENWGVDDRDFDDLIERLTYEKQYREQLARDAKDPRFVKMYALISEKSRELAIRTRAIERVVSGRWEVYSKTGIDTPPGEPTDAELAGTHAGRKPVRGKAWEFIGDRMIWERCTGYITTLSLKREPRLEGAPEQPDFGVAATDPQYCRLPEYVIPIARGEGFDPDRARIAAALECGGLRIQVHGPSGESVFYPKNISPIDGITDKHYPPVAKPRVRSVQRPYVKSKSGNRTHIPRRPVPSFEMAKRLGRPAYFDGGNAGISEWIGDPVQISAHKPQLINDQEMRAIERQAIYQSLC